MARATVALALSLACAAANAQQGGSITVVGGGDFFVTQPPTMIGTTPGHLELTTQVYVVTDFTGLFAAAARPDLGAAPPLAYRPGGEPALVTVEGDGVRMPDEQFTLP